MDPGRFGPNPGLFDDAEVMLPVLARELVEAVREHVNIVEILRENVRARPRMVANPPTRLTLLTGAA